MEQPDLVSGLTRLWRIMKYLENGHTQAWIDNNQDMFDYYHCGYDRVIDVYSNWRKL